MSCAYFVAECQLSIVAVQEKTFRACLLITTVRFNKARLLAHLEVCCVGDFETEQVLLEYRGEFWFLLVLWTSCIVFFTLL